MEKYGVIDPRYTRPEELSTRPKEASLKELEAGPARRLTDQVAESVEDTRSTDRPTVE